MSLYEGELREHYKSPRNYGALDDASGVGRAMNPLCGDEVTVYVAVDAQRVQDVRYEGHLCAVSKAAGSLMTEAIKGKREAEIRDLAALFEAMMRGQNGDPLGGLDALREVRRYRVRIRCATLPWDALQAALDDSGNRA